MSKSDSTGLQTSGTIDAEKSNPVHSIVLAAHWSSLETLPDYRIYNEAVAFSADTVKAQVDA